MSRYERFGPTLGHEELKELRSVQLSVETLEEGLWILRACRDRKIQLPARLLVFVDDATSALMELRSYESDSAFSYFTTTRFCLA